MEIRICHLYHDILNLYGDRGNITAMKDRLERRNIKVSVDTLTIGDRLDISLYDIFFIGGGQDFEQEILLKDIKKGKADAIKHAIDEYRTFLAICGGYQLLGNYYKTWDGTMLEFIGAVDFHTLGFKERMIGNYMFEAKLGKSSINIVGFENHSGKTYLGNGVSPLGTVIKGFGNNGEDAGEGIHHKNVFGTYSHGPVLPKNPKLCDYILKTALKQKYGFDEELPALPDDIEIKAHNYMENRLREKVR